MRFLIYLLLTCAAICCSPFIDLAAGSDTNDDLPMSLDILPSKITIIGADRVQQIVVTGHFPNDIVRDLTSQAALRVADERIAKVGSAGLLLPVANGTTSVVAEYQGKTVTVP